MVTNILDMVKGAISNQTVDQMGQLLGEDSTKTNSAISAALPAILGGLMKQSSTPGGANDLFNAVKGADTGIFNNIAGAIGGGKHSSLIQTGMGMLSTIFGGSQSGLIGSIARMAGIGNNSAGSLLGMLAPIVMGAIGNLRSRDNLDAGGLANLLAGQRDHVASALPGQLRTDLGLDSVLGGRTDTTVTNDTVRRDDRPARSGGLLGKILPLVILGALAWLGYQYFSSTDEAVVASDKASITETVDVSKMNVEELTGKVTGSIGDMTAALGGITDEASAQGAVEKLKGAASSLGGFDLSALSGEAKTAVGGAASPLIEKFKAALETAYAIPGVKAIIEPIVNPVLGTLNGLIG